MRIVSLVPSITELLYYLGLDRETVGITKFCVHPPEWHQTKPRVGGTKNIQIESVKALNPSLIIASKEENVKEQVAQLSVGCQVLLTDVTNFREALEMIALIGALTNKTKEAGTLMADIEEQFASLNARPLLTATYLIWKDPWMTVGKDTFIYDMLLKAGFQNIPGGLRYPATGIEQLYQLKPVYVLLSSEPYPFKQQQAFELQKLLPSSKVILTDGEMFSWYGSRMRYAPAYFKTLRQQLNEL